MIFTPTAMRYSVFLILTFSLILSQSGVFAGNPGNKPANSNEIIQRANELHDSGNYQASIMLLNTVHRVDDNYLWACYELALNYYYSDQPELALAKCREAEFLNYDHPYLFSLMGSIYDDLGRPGEGIVMLKKALAKWPYNQNLLYNLGICYLNADKPDSAAFVFEKSVLFYPYHTRSHMGLAKANYAMGRLTESYLASNMAILMSPNNNNILEYENALGGKSSVNPRLHAYPYPPDCDHRHLDELRYLLQSEMAFSKGFDYPYAMDYTFTRQSYLLFSNLKGFETDKSIYGRLYAALFSEMMNKGLFETFTYYCMNNIGNTAAVEWNKKNKAKIDQFVQWAQQFIDTGREFGYDKKLQAENTTVHNFNNGTLGSIGKFTGAELIKQGEFIIIAPEGNISERGTYVNNLAEGEWKIFWPNGNVKQKLNYVHDKLNGIIETYYPDGSRSFVYPFTDGLKNGITEEYTSAGFLKGKNRFVNGVLDGPGLYNNHRESFTREFNYKSDTLEGTTTEKWLDGRVKLTYHLKKGLYEGEYKSWYANGKPESVYNYTNDLKSGPWANYHTNGALSDTGMYVNARWNGELKSYDRNGLLSLVERQYAEGLLTGASTTYFENGQENTRQNFLNDTAMSIECFDIKGKLMYSADADKGKIYYKAYYDDGIMRCEGILNNGRNEGTWRYYNTLGQLESEYQYENNLREGLQKTFHENGQVSEIFSCDSGNMVGGYTSYFINGHVQSRGYFTSEGREGIWTNYYENDSIESLSFYRNGRIKGIYIRFHPDGTKDYETFYNDDSEEVRTITYNAQQEITDDWKYEWGAHEFTSRYSNGNPRVIARMADNVRHGVQEVYYPNGNLSHKTNYLHGKEHGNTKVYDYKGNLTADYTNVYDNLDGKYTLYENGKPDFYSEYELGYNNGTVTDYYEHNGNPFRVMSVVNNQRHGITDYFAPDGNLMYRIRFSKNCMKGISWKNPNGSFTAETRIDSTTKSLTSYYPNGKPSAKFSFYKGLYHGKMTTYYANGLTLAESEYNLDWITGLKKEYYADGKPREFTNYANNNKHGLYTKYHSNGKKSIEGNYYNDLRHGIWNCYDVNGKLIQVLHYEYDEIVKIEDR